MADRLSEIRGRALRRLQPPPRLRLSEWVEEHLRLPESNTALPGRVRLWAYQRGIADAISDQSIERVTVVKPVRVGFTMLLTGALASYVANEPSPILALLPTEADCRDYVVSDLEPVFEATPTLRGLISAEADETGRNTLMSRRFPGGSLKIVAAKSPRNLRRHTVRVLIIDEADGMETTQEGDPITLAERRTLSFANRKIIMGSTPVDEETSNVLRSYAQSDKRVFEVPCPECGAFTEILWSHIEWEEGKPETAAYRCPECKELIDERRKGAMVDQGRWRATAPERRTHAGFRLNALVSSLANASWSKLAEEFIAKKDNPDQLQTFVNTILAQGWKESADEIDETALQSRCEPFSLSAIPPDVLSITGGCDVQDDRLEVTLIGWSRDGTMYILGHVVIWGSPDDDLTWAELDSLSKTTWKHPRGGTLRLDAMVVDSGDGDWTDTVYAYCFPRSSRRIMAGKGVYGSRPFVQASKTKVKGGRLFLVGVDVIKTTLINRLSRGMSIRFSDTLEPVWFEQLASERRVVRYVRGRPERRFDRKKGSRAEALDCVVYAFAARMAVTVDFDRRSDETVGHPAPQVQAASPTNFINRDRGSWLNR